METLRSKGTLHNNCSQRMFVVFMCIFPSQIQYSLATIFFGLPSNFMSGGPSGGEASLGSHWGSLTSVATGGAELQTRPAEGGDCIGPGVTSTPKNSLAKLWVLNFMPKELVKLKDEFFGVNTLIYINAFLLNRKGVEFTILAKTPGNLFRGRR